MDRLNWRFANVNLEWLLDSDIAQVWKTSFWMAHYGKDCPKRSTFWGNSEEMVGRMDRGSGWIWLLEVVGKWYIPTWKNISKFFNRIPTLLGQRKIDERTESTTIPSDYQLAPHRFWVGFGLGVPNLTSVFEMLNIEISHDPDREVSRFPWRHQVPRVRKLEEKWVAASGSCFNLN